MSFFQLSHLVTSKPCGLMSRFVSQSGNVHKSRNSVFYWQKCHFVTVHVKKLFWPTDGKLWQGTAEPLSNMGQFLKLRLLLSAILAQNLLLQPLVRLQREKERKRESETSTANLPWHRCILAERVIYELYELLSHFIQCETVLFNSALFSCWV